MLERLFQQVSALSPRRILLGYSGGVDSQVLLHLLSQLAQKHLHFPEILAIHVNHGLQSESVNWQNFCQAECDKLSIPMLAKCIELDANSNIEEQARLARFNAFVGEFQSGDVLLLAHHANDQAETVLYRLFRGAGVKGIAAMNDNQLIDGMTVLRPLLRVPRLDIEQYANECELKWVEDGSNADERYDRNFIRKSVLPVIEERWPQAVKRLGISSQYFSEADQLLSELAAIDLLAAGAELTCLPFSSLMELSAERQKNALRYWLSNQSIRISEKQLMQLINQVILAKEDADPLLEVDGRMIKRFKQSLYLVEGSELDCFEPFVWQAKNSCDIKGFGTLKLLRTMELNFEVKPRAGGERLTLKNATHSKSLKSVLQEMSIPSWQRSNLPLIYFGGELIAVADILLTKQGEELLCGNKIVRDHS